MIRVTVIHMRPVFVQGLTQVLVAHGFRVVGAWGSLPDEQAWLSDTVVVDAEVLRSADALSQVAALSRRSAVVMLTADRHRHLESAFLRAGAVATVSEREPAHVLVQAIHTAIATALPAYRPATAAASSGVGSSPAQSLSRRESQVLLHISLGLTHLQVANRLGISQHTVDTYVKRIRSKLGVRNKAELTRVALGGSVRVSAPATGWPPARRASPHRPGGGHRGIA